MCIEKLQKQIRTLRENGCPLSLSYGKGQSNTTRSKQYKNNSPILECGPLNRVLSLDLEKKQITVEPRITMEELVKATLPHGLIPPIIPEFKGITVGGALMGCAAESTSHQWGIFHDICKEIVLLDGEGNLTYASPTENSDLFYGLSGCYGSFGLIISATLTLIPASKSVHLTYHRFADPAQALQKMRSLIGKCDFLDGIVYSQKHAVVMEGNQVMGHSKIRRRSKWFASSVLKDGHGEETFSLYDYLFRYDQGAFWMGSFLFSLPFLYRYIKEGILNYRTSSNWFNMKEIFLFKNLPFPGFLAQRAAAPLMQSQRLWFLLHQAEKWVQERLVIQDLCIPEEEAPFFLETLLKDPGVFPIWLCPLKGTQTPQHFAPHYGHPSLINFGLYGVPSYSAPMKEVLQKLEKRVEEVGGKKVLYSCSFYTEEDFWRIYPQEIYEALRKKTHAHGVWHSLTEKVLSE